MWPKEEIPNEAAMFMRLPRKLVPNNEVGPNVFREHGRGMSVDWNKYSTPEETRKRSRKSPPQDNAVIGMIVRDIRGIESLEVEHDPVQENSFDEAGAPLEPNRAHSEVIGISSDSAEKKTERRLKLSRIWHWEIRLED
jgi:hypothetical protein